MAGVDADRGTTGCAGHGNLSSRGLAKGRRCAGSLSARTLHLWSLIGRDGQATNPAWQRARQHERWRHADAFVHGLRKQRSVEQEGCGKDPKLRS